jgi:FeS assembly SUF system protein
MENKPNRVPLETLDDQHGHHKREPIADRPADLPEFAPEAPEDLREKVIQALQTCYDPELPINIYELGLIYDVAIDPSGAVAIKMTLTSPACPVAGSLPPEVEAKVRAIPGVASVKVDVVWDPPWTQERMSEAARLQLGLF